MTFRKSTTVIAMFMLITLAGCQEPEGPAEKAGKEMDKAASALGDTMESAGNHIKEAITPRN